MFGDRLKDLREDKDMTQENLAEYLKTTRQSISRYENNTNQPSFESLVQIADLFNVSLDYLLCRTNEKYNLNLTNVNRNNKEIILSLYELLNNYNITPKK